MTSKKGKGSTSLTEQIENLLAPKVQEMGYELVSLEYQHRSREGGPVLRLFIDQLNPEAGHIGIEDCVKVDHGLSEFVESPEFTELHPSEFTLEVSSPGVDRPLTRKQHFQRFIGNKVRVKTFRPLTSEELTNPSYFEVHPKQKNFSGVLRGIKEEAVLMEVDSERIEIPLLQIAKANLDIADGILNSPGFLGKSGR